VDGSGKRFGSLQCGAACPAAGWKIRTERSGADQERPIDFQVREPASPLFGTLEKINQAIELQITQEYFGQAGHSVFLAPMWKEVLDFDMHAQVAATARP
jgi:hypothetical protein